MKSMLLSASLVLFAATAFAPAVSAKQSSAHSELSKSSLTQRIQQNRDMRGKN